MNLSLYQIVFSLILCFLFINIASAQKPYSKGQFLINEELRKTDDADLDFYNEWKNGQLKPQLSNQFIHFAYNDSLVSRVIMDSLGNIRSRIVWNYDSRKKLTFIPEEGRIYYSTSEIKPSQLSQNIVNGDETIEDSKGRIYLKKRKEGKIGE